MRPKTVLQPGRYPAATGAKRASTSSGPSWWKNTPPALGIQTPAFRVGIYGPPEYAQKHLHSQEVFDGIWMSRAGN